MSLSSINTWDSRSRAAENKMSMLWSFKWLALFTLHLHLTSAFAEEIEVFETIAGCKYFVAEQGYDYILVESWSCMRPAKGDQGSGDLNSYGSKTVRLAGMTCTVWIDDYLLSRSRALEKLAEKCD